MGHSQHTWSTGDIIQAGTLNALEQDLAAAFDRSNHTGSQAASTVTGLDSAIASAVAAGGSATAAAIAADPALKAAYGAPPLGRTFVILGDSRAALETDASPGTQQRGAFTWANQILRQRAKVLAYKGVSGDTLTGMLSRFATDVAAYSPANVLLIGGINDISASSTYAQMQTRFLALIAACKGIGARLVVTTIAPNGSLTTGQNTVLGQTNQWLKAITDPAVLVVDTTTPVAATTGMAYAANMSTDGLHQSRIGAARQGKALAAALDSFLPRTDPLPVGAGYSGNAVPNPLIDGTVGANVPSGWTVFPAQGSSITYSIVARTDQGGGNWFQAVTAAGGFPAYLAATGSLSGVATTGDYVEAIVEVSSDAGWSNVTGDVRLYCQLLDVGGTAIAVSYDGTHDTGPQMGDSGDSTAFPTENQPGVGTPWVFRTPPLLVPSTATQGKFLFEFGGQGTLRLGRAALRKV